MIRIILVRGLVQISFRGHQEDGIVEHLDRVCFCHVVDLLSPTVRLYSVSQKTSPTFLAVTLESIVGFS